VTRLEAHTPLAAVPDVSEAPVVARLSRLDRLLLVWIGAAMAAGIGLGRLVPGLDTSLDAVAIHGTSLPIAVGLLLMMYPVLAKVRYGEIRKITAASLTLNWIVGPAVMFALAWLLLPDQPAYRSGVILVGLARCIAMVLIWTDLADGDLDMAAVLVALNPVFQVVAYAALGVFYLKVLPGWLGLRTETLSLSMGTIAGTVAVFLGIPLVAGYLTRALGERSRGRQWYEKTFLPRISPVALYGLLFTVVILFALQGRSITSEPADVARIALPLLGYFAVMWSGGFLVGRRLHLTYARTAALALSAANNDFELAIAVAIGVFGVTSGQALAGVGGPAHRGAGAPGPGVRGAVGPAPLLSDGGAGRLVISLPPRRRRRPRSGEKLGVPRGTVVDDPSRCPAHLHGCGRTSLSGLHHRPPRDRHLLPRSRLSRPRALRVCH
jgi:ACR3 family arsenite transporter